MVNASYTHTMQHTATHQKILLHTATHCNTGGRIRGSSNASYIHFDSRIGKQHIAARCNTLQQGGGHTGKWQRVEYSLLLAHRRKTQVPRPTVRRPLSPSHTSGSNLWFRCSLRGENTFVRELQEERTHSLSHSVKPVAHFRIKTLVPLLAERRKHICT